MNTLNQTPILHYSINKANGDKVLCGPSFEGDAYWTEAKPAFAIPITEQDIQAAIQVVMREAREEILKEAKYVATIEKFSELLDKAIALKGNEE